MGVGAAVFESAGKRTEHWIPGAYSRSNTVSSPSGISAGNLCIMGKAVGGEPFKLLEFGSVAEAKETLLSGELLNAVAYAFSGSNDYIPQKVYAMKVNNGTAATLTLQSNTSDILKITSTGYGSPYNGLKLKIETGTSTNSKKLTVVYKSESTSIDDIVQESMSIVGQGTSPTVTIGTDSIILSTTVDDEAVTETFSFADYDTVSALVNRINDTDYFVATMLDSNEEALSSDLDTISGVDISENAKFYSNLAAFIEALESISYFGDVEVLTTATRTVPDNVSYTYFSGGSEGTYGTEQWTQALEVLEQCDIQNIATPSTETSVQNLIKNHCVSMSSTDNKKERMALIGGALNETDDAALTRTHDLNSDLVSYVTDNAKVINPLTGDTETINGAMLACLLAGVESAMAVHIPLTNKTLNVLGFSKLRNRTNMTKLIKGGVMVCNPSPDDNTNYVVIRALTTYQKSDLIKNERSMTREAMYMDRDLRNRYATAIGSAGNVGTSEYLSTLRAAAEEWKKSGYIVMNDNNENIWNEKCSIDGDKIKITYSRYLTPPVNFIFITVTNHVYTSTTTV